MIKALVIEDSRSARTLINITASSDMGYATDLSEDATSAIAFAEKNSYHLVLLDWMLPDLDGVELCRKLRNISGTRSSIIVMITAKDSLDDIKSALDAGVDDYITKPFTPEQLKIRLTIAENLIRQKMKKALIEIELQSAKERYKTLFQESSDMILITDKAGLIRYANPALKNSLGYSEDNLSGKDFLSLLPPENRDSVEQSFHGLSPTSLSLPFSSGFLTANGSVRKLAGNILGNLISGDISEVRFLLKDQTDSISSQLAVQFSEAKVRGIFNAALDGIISINTRGIIEMINPAALEMFGYEKDELLGQNVSKLAPPPHNERHDDHIAAYLKTGESKIIGKKLELTGKKKDGSVFPMSLSVSEVEIEGQRIFIGTIHDLTTRHENQKRLREFNEQLKEIHRLNLALYANEEEIFSDYLETGCRIFDYTCGIVARVRDGQIHVVAADKKHPELLATDINDELFTQPVSSRETITTGEFQAQSAFLQKRNIKDFIVTPILFNSEVDGILGFFDSGGEPKDYLQQKRDVVQLMAQGIRKFLESRHSEKIMKDARVIAEKANKAKSEFLSSMSHELRTPLNAISGFSQLLAADTLTAEQMELVQHISRAGDHLLNLINEILDLAKIEAGQVTMSIEPVAIAKLLQDCTVLIQPMATRQKISYQCDPTPLTDTLVLADMTRLKQVLLNLLSNGIKYNRENGSLSVTAEILPENLKIKITDTGRGISAEQIKNLFQPFNRLGQESGEIEGTGIGLTITKHIIELMNGSIGVESTPGTGSTFWITIPLHKGQTEAAPKEDTVVRESRFRNKNTILYVEDNPINLKLVEKIFARFPEITLLSAPNGPAGLELAMNKSFDLIILDINLPGMNGFEILEKLQTTESTRNIPVLALSANALPNDVEKGLKAGFSRYITKPINIQELVEAVHTTIHNKQPQDS